MDIAGIKLVLIKILLDYDTFLYKLFNEGIPLSLP